MEEVIISKQDYEDFKEWQRLKYFVPPMDIHKKENWDTEYCQGYLKGEWDAKMWFAKELQKGNYPDGIKEVIDRAKIEGRISSTKKELGRWFICNESIHGFEKGKKYKLIYGKEDGIIGLDPAFINKYFSPSSEAITDFLDK